MGALVDHHWSIAGADESHVPVTLKLILSEAQRAVSRARTDDILPA